MIDKTNKTMTPLQWLETEIKAAAKKENQMPIDKVLKLINRAKEIEKVFLFHREVDTVLKAWDKGGFVSDERYKQPVKHRKY